MVEYFDERSTEFITKTANRDTDIGSNYRYLSHVQASFTISNRSRDIRLSEIYYALGIPFPNNYLLDYKLKKKEPAFEISYDKKLGKIMMDIDVPDQPVLRDLGNAFEYTFTLRKED